MNTHIPDSARQRVKDHARKLKRDRIRLGGAACGDPVAINSLLTVYAPMPGLHAALASGLCAYALGGGDTDDEAAQIQYLRDGGFVNLWNEAEYLLQCLRDYREWSEKNARRAEQVAA